MILFIVREGSDRVVGEIDHVICTASGREDAKRKARKVLLSNPDHFIVTPLTKDGDRIHLVVTAP